MKEDKLGPRENQSPRHKNHPSNGGNPEIPSRVLEDSLIGGNKHSSSGGGTDDYHGSNSCVKSAREHEGIDTYPNDGHENFEE